MTGQSSLNPKPETPSLVSRDSPDRDHSPQAVAQSDSKSGPSANFSSTDADQSLLATASYFDKVISLCEDFSRESAKAKQDLRSYLVQVGKDDQPTLLRNLLE